MSKTEHKMRARPSSERRYSLALNVSLAYLLLSLLWILFSDQVALSIADSTATLARIETFKGIVFVCLSAILIYCLINRGLRRQQAADQALQLQKQQLAELIDNLPGIVYRCRYDGNWTMELFAGAVESITGYAVDEVLHNHVISYNDMTLEADRAYIRRTIDAALEQDRPFILEYRIRHKNGDERWIYEQGRALRDDAGRVELLEGFLQDITEQYSALRQLRDSEERFRLLQEGVPDCALILFDDRARLMHWNSAVYRLYGYSESDISRVSFADMFTTAARTADKPAQALEQARVSGAWHAEIEQINKSAWTFHAAITLTALWSENGSLRGYSAFVRKRPS